MLKKNTKKNKADDLMAYTRSETDPSDDNLAETSSDYE